MSKRRLVSAARKELFELFDEVISKEGAKVILEHRGSSKCAVLVSKEYVDHLEHTVHERVQARAPFSLFGSVTLNVAAATVLESVRAEQAHLSEAKHERLASRNRKS